jgi:hypothetical protein
MLLSEGGFERIAKDTGCLGRYDAPQAVARCSRTRRRSVMRHTATQTWGLSNASLALPGLPQAAPARATDEDREPSRKRNFTPEAGVKSGLRSSDRSRKW